MIDIDTLKKYVPKIHGEHGVDSVIHRKINKSNKLYEAYSNPPGASWASIQIHHPEEDAIFTWDHIPRDPDCAKRPDSIIQYNDGKEINILSLESKEKFSNAYNDMNDLLKKFFIGSDNFNGLFNRPFAHKLFKGMDSKYIGNNDEIAYWIKNYKNKKMFSGFAFAFQPELYEKFSDFDTAQWKIKMNNLASEKDLDIVIGVGWRYEIHEPFTVIVTNVDFAKTNFCTEIVTCLSIQ